MADKIQNYNDYKLNKLSENKNILSTSIMSTTVVSLPLFVYMAAKSLKNFIGTKKGTKSLDYLDFKTKELFGAEKTSPMPKDIKYKIYKPNYKIIISVINKLRVHLKSENEKTGKIEQMTPEQFLKYVNTYFFEIGLNDKLEMPFGFQLSKSTSGFGTGDFDSNIPILGASYILPYYKDSDKIIIKHDNNIRDFYLFSNDNLWKKYVDILKLVVEHEMVHRGQHIDRKLDSPVGVSFLTAILTPRRILNYYNTKYEAEAHALLTIRMLKKEGFKYTEVEELIKQEKGVSNRINIPSYSYKDINRYFKKKDKLYKYYIKMLDQYSKDIYKDEIKFKKSK